MATDNLMGFLKQLGKQFDDQGPRTDSDCVLLQRFSTQRSEHAFATLLYRHGSLVWGVCRRMLRHEQVAEDAFQAVFLVLAKKAGSRHWRTNIGPWLHEVACRICRKVRNRSVQEGSDPTPEPVCHQNPYDAIIRNEFSQLLDEEIVRLPHKYRSPRPFPSTHAALRCIRTAKLLPSPDTTSRRLARGSNCGV